MVDSKYTDNNLSSKISAAAVIKNPKMLKLVPNHLQT